MSEARSIPRRLWELALPVIGLNVLNVLALAVDTAMCGRVPDAEAALTGLGFASQIVFLLMVAMIGLVVGAVATVARAHGAGQTDRVEHVFNQASQLTVLLSVAIGILGNLAARPMLELLGAQGAALEAGLDYLRPLLAGTVFYYLNLLYAGILRGIGNTRLPFVVAVGSNLVNVVVNYGLILGNFGLPALGVQGAAFGTVIAQATAVVAIFALLRGGAVDHVRPAIRPVAIDVPLARDLARVGAPAALDMVVIQGAFLAIVGMLGRLDQVTVAAHGIGLRIQALAFVPGLSISQATGAMVGQSLGAGDVEEARSVVRAAILLCVGVMTAFAVPIVLGRHGILTIFDIQAGTEMARYTLEWIQILGYAMPVVGVHIAYVGMFRGAGDTNTSLFINIVATTLQIPGSYLLGFTLGWGAFGVWVAFPISFGLRIVFDHWFYRRGAWAKIGARVT